jgi:oligo-1,6-glucosidase
MERTFWKEGVVYQIYPRSFMDSDGDGIGDLKGIVSRLDYLKELGIDMVWLGPVYASPNEDNGYDISDYRAIMNEFGTMADWEALLAGLHERGIKLIMDFVVNHTSDEHAWFEQSRAAKDNPYRDYYIWRPGKPDGREPNNWTSFFGGSAWERDERTGEYYLHLFSRKQPDLNWDNPKLRQEIFDMMTFWLDKGIDGFRMDVINCISKAEGLPDAPGGGRYEWGGAFFLNGPHIHDYLQEMNEKVLTGAGGRDIVTVGETPGVTPEQAQLYTDPVRHELHMVFQFETMDIDSWGVKWHLKPWTLHDLKQVTTKWQLALAGKGWNSLYLNNHDQPRMVSRFGDDGQYRKESAKLLATFLHTLQGTPFIYQGEELGMTNVRFPSIHDYRDVEALHYYKEAVDERHEDASSIMEAIYAKGRDNARTPMQWDETANAGFTTGEPWIAVNPNYKQINSKEAQADPDSIFHYYRKLLQLRKQHPIMAYGDYRLLLEDHQQLYVYVRRLDQEQWLVILNFSREETGFELPMELRGREQGAALVIANYSVPSGDSLLQLTLRPYEARVYRLADDRHVVV